MDFRLPDPGSRAVLPGGGATTTSVQRDRLALRAGNHADVFFGGDDLPPWRCPGPAVTSARVTDASASARDARARWLSEGVPVPDDQQGAAGRHPGGKYGRRRPAAASPGCA